MRIYYAKLVGSRVSISLSASVDVSNQPHRVLRQEPAVQAARCGSTRDLRYPRVWACGVRHVSDRRQ